MECTRSKANSPPSKMLTARPIVDICPTGAYKHEKTGASYGDGSSSRSGATWVSSVLKGTFVSVEELIGEVGEDVEEDDDDDIVGDGGHGAEDTGREGDVAAGRKGGAAGAGDPGGPGRPGEAVSVHEAAVEAVARACCCFSMSLSRDVLPIGRVVRRR